MTTTLLGWELVSTRKERQAVSYTILSTTSDSQSFTISSAGACDSRGFGR